MEGALDSSEGVHYEVDLLRLVVYLTEGGVDYTYSVDASIAKQSADGK